MHAQFVEEVSSLLGEDSAPNLEIVARARVHRYRSPTTRPVSSCSGPPTTDPVADDQASAIDQRPLRIPGRYLNAQAAQRGLHLAKSLPRINIRGKVQVSESW